MATTTTELLSTGECARLLGSSRQHVVDLCERGVLQHVWAGSHRRVPRGEIERMLMGSRPVLTRDQERALWLHRALLPPLLTDSDEVLRRARANLDQLRRVHPRGMTAHWLREWEKVVRHGVDAVADAFTSPSPHAVELRQNSPFAGVMSQQTRADVLTAFRRHWRREHSGQAASA